MPLHLSPISRRQFIARSAAAAAYVALGRKLLAVDKPAAPHSWALLADTHIAADREKTSRGVAMTQNLAAVCRELEEWPDRPAGVLVNGDCAFNAGEPGDYAAFTDLLDPIRRSQLPIHITLGNHDARDHFWTILKEANSSDCPVPDRQVSILRSERANWFLLDSLDKTNSTPGLLGETQLEWLAKALDRNTDKPALLFAHHDLAKGETKSALKDTEKLLALIEPRRHVKAYIFGHTHKWQIQQDSSGIHLINLPPVAYVFTEGDPNGWVHANLLPDGIRLQLRCLDQKHSAQGQIVDLKWREG